MYVSLTLSIQLIINLALSRDQCSINQFIAQVYSRESIDCELLKTSQFAFNRYSQLKPDLRYVAYVEISFVNIVLYIMQV